MGLPTFQPQTGMPMYGSPISNWRIKRHIQYIMTLSNFMGSDNFQKGNNRSEQIFSNSLRDQIRKERQKYSETSEKICKFLMEHWRVKRAILGAAMKGKRHVEIFADFRDILDKKITRGKLKDIRLDAMSVGYAKIRFVEMLEEQDFQVEYINFEKARGHGRHKIIIKWTDLS